MTNDQQACREALKPCPFCGAVPKIKEWTIAGLTQAKIRCDSDYCIVCPSILMKRDPAITAWNARAPQPAGDEVNDDIIADALYAFLRERSAQMGEHFTRQQLDALRAEQPESYDEDMVSMRCALRAAIAAMPPYRGNARNGAAADSDTGNAAFERWWHENIETLDYDKETKRCALWAWNAAPPFRASPRNGHKAECICGHTLTMHNYDHDGAIVAARQEGIRKGLEMAAGVADQCAEIENQSHVDTGSHAAAYAAACIRDVETEIRALIEKGGKCP